MGKSIKHQFVHAIDNGFRQGQDKHAMKKAGYERQSTIFSFADRKNLNVQNKFATISFEGNDIAIDFYNIDSGELEKDRVCQSVRLPLG